MLKADVRETVRCGVSTQISWPCNTKYFIDFQKLLFRDVVQVMVWRAKVGWQIKKKNRKWAVNRKFLTLKTFANFGCFNQELHFLF